jgi:hypothetical protein
VQDTANPPNSPPGVYAAGSNGTPKLARAVLTSGLVTNTDTQAALTLQSHTDSSTVNGVATLAAGSIGLGANGTVVIDDNASIVYMEVPVTPPGGPLVGAGLYANANGNPSTVTPAGLAGGTPASQATQGGNTNNTTSLNAMFTPYGIPANDPSAGTTYRVTCGGHGTQATGSAVALNFRVAAFGTTWGSSTDTGGVAAGDNFHWRFTGELILGGAGNNEPASFFGTMVISQATASAQGHPTAMDSQVASGIDTTVNNSITLQAGWASTTGSPTLVCTGSVFERLGP